MATDNTIVLVGNLVDDPELRFTPQGVAVANFRMAVSRRVPDGNGGWKDADTSFFRVNCWRQLAENVAESLQRGSRPVVSGRGERGQGVGPSLKWATAKVEKTSRGGGGGGRGGDSGGGDDWGTDSAPAPVDEEVPF